MKKVIIYLKSGNKLTLKCETFEFKIDQNGVKRELEITGVNKYEWMIDLSEVEAYVVTRCLF